MYQLHWSHGPDRHFHYIANPHQLDGRDLSPLVHALERQVDPLFW
jgi:hypothetical protein